MSESKKKLVRFAKKVVEMLIYLLVGYFIYQKLDGQFELFLEAEIRPTPLITAILIYATHTILNGYAWDYLIRSSGEKTKLIEQMSVYIRSYLLRYIPGNVVGIMARGVLNKPYGIPMFKSLWGWFFENITYLSLGILIGSFAILQTRLDSGYVLILMVTALCVGTFLLLKNDLLEKFFAEKVSKKFKSDLSEEIEPLSLSVKARVNLLLFYLAAWGIYSISFLLAVSAAGVDPFNSPLMLISINAIAYSIGYLSLVTPSGAGVREGVMVYFLTSSAGMSPEDSVIIAVVARIMFVAGEVLSAVLFYLAKFTFLRHGKAEN